MLPRNGSAVFLASWIDACALWRMYFPHLGLRDSGFFCFSAKPDWNKIAGYDVVVLQRCCTKPQFEFIKTCRAMEQKLVYDLDDNIWQIPETNPAAAILHKHSDGFKVCIRSVDVVSVSTKTLKKVVERHVKNMTNLHTGKEIPIVVTENRLDERLFVPPVKSEQTIVGWAGSTSHIGDLRIIEDAIKTLAVEYPQVIFEFRGLEPPEGLREVPNVRFKIWYSVAEYAARMPRWGWSIALAPVTDEDFNNSKSAIKILEAAYCKIPCLASWVQPYFEFYNYDKELMWLLCAGRNNWAPKIRELINDPARRVYLGERMYQVMKKYYSWENGHDGWRKVLALL